MGKIEKLQTERDEARSIVRDIFWMARRYADGRQSYAVGMFNDAIRKAFDGGWLEDKCVDEPRYARDGMWSHEWISQAEIIRAQVARISELEEGLRPFAEAAQWITENKPHWDRDHAEVQLENFPYTLGVGWLRKAHALLSKRGM